MSPVILGHSTTSRRQPREGSPSCITIFSNILAILSIFLAFSIDHPESHPPPVAMSAPGSRRGSSAHLTASLGPNVNMSEIASRLQALATPSRGPTGTPPCLFMSLLSHMTVTSLDAFISVCFWLMTMADANATPSELSLPPASRGRTRANSQVSPFLHSAIRRQFLIWSLILQAHTTGCLQPHQNFDIPPPIQVCWLGVVVFIVILQCYLLDIESIFHFLVFYPHFTMQLPGAVERRVPMSLPPSSVNSPVATPRSHGLSPVITPHSNYHMRLVTGTSCMYLFLLTLLAHPVFLLLLNVGDFLQLSWLTTATRIIL